MDYIIKLFEMLVRADASSEAVDSKLASTVEPAYLVLGGAPDIGANPTHGRTFLYNEHYWILDHYIPEAGINTSRFFKTDFNNAAEMVFLASKLPKQFDAIIFDYSSIKFFFTDPASLVIRLQAIKNMLKDDGSIFTEISTADNEEIKLFYEKYHEAGLIIFAMKPYTEFKDIEVVRDVYLTGKLPDYIRETSVSGTLQILEIKKTIEGGRRTKKSRQRKTRKSSRKVPQIIKNRF